MLNEPRAAISRNAREAGGQQPARAGDPRLARQSQRRRGGRRDRGQSARGRPDAHALRRDDAQGRPRRQCASAERDGDGQLPHLAGRAAEGGPGRAPAARRARRSRSRPIPSFIGVPTPASPLRPDVLKRRHGRDPAASTARQMHVFPVMSTGASDGSLLPRQGNSGLRRRRQLGHLAARRARARPRRAHPGPGDVRRRALLGDDHARRWRARRPQARAAFSTSSAWPGTFTLRQLCRTRPSAPIR